MKIPSLSFTDVTIREMPGFETGGFPIENLAAGLKLGADRALGIIRMGQGRAKYRHHRIADMLVHTTAKVLHDTIGGGKKSVQQLMDFLRVALRR